MICLLTSKVTHCATATVTHASLQNDSLATLLVRLEGMLGPLLLPYDWHAALAALMYRASAQRHTPRVPGGHLLQHICGRVTHCAPANLMLAERQPGHAAGAPGGHPGPAAQLDDQPGPLQQQVLHAQQADLRAQQEQRAVSGLTNASMYVLGWLGFGTRDLDAMTRPAEDQHVLLLALGCSRFCPYNAGSAAPRAVLRLLLAWKLAAACCLIAGTSCCCPSAPACSIT